MNRLNPDRKLYDALKKIGHIYMTPEQIKRDSKNSGLDYVEYLEMAYDNIQQEARAAIYRMKRPAEKIEKEVE